MSKSFSEKKISSEYKWVYQPYDSSHYESLCLWKIKRKEEVYCMVAADAFMRSWKIEAIVGLAGILFMTIGPILLRLSMRH